MRIPISSASDWELVDGTQDIRGWPVETAVGDPVGRVADLLIDTEIEQIDELILEGGARVFPEDVTLGDRVVTLRPDARLRGTSSPGGMSVSRIGELPAPPVEMAALAMDPPLGAGPTDEPATTTEPPLGWAPRTEPFGAIESGAGPEPEPGAEHEPEPAHGGVPEAAPEPQSDDEVQAPPDPADDDEPPVADAAPPGAPPSLDEATRPQPIVRRESTDVEIEKRIVEEEHNVDIPVMRDRVQIRRIVVDRPADGTERPYWQGDEYRIPVVSERIEIRRVLRVVEELIVTREQIHDVEHIRETVRREAVTVREQRDGDAGGRSSERGTTPPQMRTPG